ncbi:MAG: DUF4253 domain-containing protein [Leptolyngbya sp. SIO1D8]|nr:DUF4253 domain-containing protein [Leptolyngbya sp. SIO1D8]
MLNAIEEIHRLLEGSHLEACEVKELRIDTCNEIAFCLRLNSVEQFQAWNHMKELISITERYPLIIDNSEDCFSRFYFEEEKDDGYITDVSPNSIISESLSVNLENFLESKKWAIREEDLNWEIEIFESQRSNESLPNWSHIRQLIGNRTISTNYDLQKFLFNWESKNCTIDYSRINSSSFDKRWTEYKDPQLLLLPISHSWESLAYIHWWGAGEIGTPNLMSLLKKWHMEFGTELFSDDGVLLQFIVNKPPSNLAAAFELAWEQNTVTSWTTEWLNLRDHTRSLQSLNRWVLFDRP